MKRINVTKSFLPSIEDYTKIISRAWHNEWLTNRGELVLELEDKIKNAYSLNHIILTNNGTVPLQIALKILGKKGEIITTPFSYVATTSSIVWENCQPVFVDIEEDLLTIDASKIEAAITKKTTAILATHVFGNPCDVNFISEIAKKYNLAVIYDAAHCFGVTYNNKSIFNFGDISSCSFHATKVFHTAEGGAMFVNNPTLQKQAFYSHNFGHDGPLDFHGLGINAKMSELQAAMGLAVFSNMDTIFKARKEVVNFYNENLNFNELKKLALRKGTNWNYSYYPIIFKSEGKLLETLANLEKENIHPRRYFYPSLNKLPYVNEVKMPVSEAISKTVLCLPLYVGLEQEDLQRITKIINNSL